MKQSKNYSNSSKERKKNGKHGNDQKSYTRYDEKTALSGYIIQEFPPSSDIIKRVIESSSFSSFHKITVSWTGILESEFES